MTIKKKKKTKNYINNADLLSEVIKSKENGKMTDEFGKMMLLLVKRYSAQGCYSGYTYVEDMESYALMTVCKVWDSFDPTKSNNPFAYFTQTIKRAFWQFLDKEKRHRDIRDEMLLNAGELPSHTFVDEYEEKEFNNEYVNCKKDGVLSDAMKAHVTKIVSQMVGYKTSNDSTVKNDSIIKEIKTRVFEDILDYDMEKTSPYKYVSSQVSEYCTELDPSAKTMSRREYLIAIESYDENDEDFAEERQYDE